MKILLLNPQIVYESWPIPGDFWRCISKVAGVTLPQLASVIENNECKIYDGNVEKIKLKDYLKLLSKFEVIAISAVSTVSALNTELTIKLIRTIFKDKKIILGGHHATAYPEEWIKKGVDIIIKNEGEITFKEVINVLNRKYNLADVKGVVFRDQDTIINNPDRELMRSLDDLPFPRWDLMNFDKYKVPFENKSIAAMVESSRGCSFNCTFCSASWMWKHRQRYKSVNRVFEEFKLLYKNGVRSIGIADDNFGYNYKRDIDILEKIVSSGMKINLWMFCRADTVLSHPDFIKIASRAGLKEVLIGFESIERKKLADYNKGIANFKDINDYRAVYKILKQYNIMVFGAFILDPLDKSPHIFNESIKCTQVCDVAMYQNFIPMKGTTKYASLQKQNLLETDAFYSERFICLLKNQDSKNRLFMFIRCLFGIFNINLLKIIFSIKRNNDRHRMRVLDIYVSLLKSIFNLSTDKILFFLNCLKTFKSSSDKQEVLLKKYLNPVFISKLINSNK